MQPAVVVEPKLSRQSNPLRELENYGQSVWLDYIRRSLLTSRQLQRPLDHDGLRGVTSNPAIFEEAIVGRSDYTDQLQSLASQRELDANRRYETLPTRDIHDTPDLVYPVYHA